MLRRLLSSRIVAIILPLAMTVPLIFVSSWIASIMLPLVVTVLLFFLYRGKRTHKLPFPILESRFSATVLSFVYSSLGLVSSVIAITHPPKDYVFVLGIKGFPDVYFYIDHLSLLFMVLVNAVALTVVPMTHFYLEHGSHPEKKGQDKVLFHLLLNLFHLSMLLVLVFDNLILMWVAVALTTWISQFLVGWADTEKAHEANLKYGMLTSAAIMLALLGTVFLDALPNGSTSYSTLMQITSEDSRPPIQETSEADYAQLAFLLALIGYGAKAGLAPTHTWVPDAHGEAPFPVSAVLSGVLLKSALFAFLRFYILTIHLLGAAIWIGAILILIGLFSLFIATMSILRPNKLKRVFGFHSIQFMGIIVLLLGFSTIFHDDQEIALALATMALMIACYHAVAKAMVFFALGYVASGYENGVLRFLEKWSKAENDSSKEPVSNSADLDQSEIDQGHTGLTKEQIKLIHQETEFLLGDRSQSSEDEVIAERNVLRLGMFHYLPVPATILAFSCLALVGVPGFNIFLNEFLILEKLERGLTTSSIVSNQGAAIMLVTAFVMLPIALLLIFGGLVNHLSTILLSGRETVRHKRRYALLAQTHPDKDEDLSWNPQLPPNRFYQMYLIGLLLGIVIFGLMPPTFYGWFEKASEVVLGRI